MNICVKCAREMACVKTGGKAVFKGAHIYAGDVFECPSCKLQIMHTSTNPYNDANIFLKPHRDPDELLIPMDMVTPENKPHFSTSLRWHWRVDGTPACASDKVNTAGDLEKRHLTCVHKYSHTLLMDVKRVMLHFPDSVIRINTGNCLEANCG